jgi:hypothetical protein
MKQNEIEVAERVGGWGYPCEEITRSWAGLLRGALGPLIAMQRRGRLPPELVNY